MSGSSASCIGLQPVRRRRSQIRFASAAGTWLGLWAGPSSDPSGIVYLTHGRALPFTHGDEAAAHLRARIPAKRVPRLVERGDRCGFRDRGWCELYCGGGPITFSVAIRCVVVLLGVVVAQVSAARRVWVRQYGDVRGLVDDCLRAGRKLELELVGKQEVASPALRVLRWVLDADRVLQEEAPAYGGDLMLTLAKDKALLRRGVDAATDTSKELSQQDAALWLRPHVDQLKAIRKELGNH